MTKRRGHFAIKFTAAVMRIGAIILVIGGLIGGLAFTQFQSSVQTQGFPAGASAIAYVVAVVVSLIYAIILWGFADALVLIADTNDAQRESAYQIAQLMLDRRTEPAASYVDPVDATQRLPRIDR
ncbi:MAG TPA: hypothetical protein VM052_06330 [Candidatus Limnocylindrales bacterium]|nr:hypothetical protein [Candidatus Limnocylindrales bacterium]